MSLENLSFDERDSLAELSKKLADNPKTRKAFLRLTKEINPDLPIPADASRWWFWCFENWPSS